MPLGQGRAHNQKLKFMRILDYLLENTDCDPGHTVNNQAIEKHLMDRWDIPAEKKSIISDIHFLEEYGIDVAYDPKEHGYRILSREFDLDELQLLIDSVQSSKFITQKKAKVITDKLKKKASRFERATLDRRTYVTNRIRSMNDSVFYGIDDIHSAIANDWQITFQYFTYNLQKKKEYFKHGERYHVSPYALLWNDDNYYLLAFEGGKMKNFRVDKMDNIKIDEDFTRREGKEAFKALKLSDRTVRVFSMFGGKEELVTIQFSNHLIGVVLDRFGKDITLRLVDKRHFAVSVNVEVSPQFYGWLCGLGKGARITWPASAVEGMGNYIKAIAEMY